MKLGETGETKERCSLQQVDRKQRHAATMQSGWLLPGEAEEDVDDDGS